MKKKIVVGLILFVLWIGAMSLFGPAPLPVYADNGVSVGNRSFTLMSSVSTTTGTAQTGVVVWDNPMNNVACDFISTNLAATGTIQFDANAGSSSSVFATNYYTYPVVKTAGAITSFSFPTKPVRILKVTYTLAPTSGITGTNAVTVNCLGVQ